MSDKTSDNISLSLCCSFRLIFFVFLVNSGSFPRQMSIGISHWIHFAVTLADPTPGTLGSSWGSCRQFRWPLTCDCSCWRDSSLFRRLRSAYRRRNSSSLEILKPYFRDREFLSSYMWIMVNAIKGSKKSQDQVGSMVNELIFFRTCGSIK